VLAQLYLLRHDCQVLSLGRYSHGSLVVLGSNHRPSHPSRAENAGREDAILTSTEVPLQYRDSAPWILLISLAQILAASLISGNVTIVGGG
jgi:hypothetical protein